MMSQNSQQTEAESAWLGLDIYLGRMQPGSNGKRVDWRDSMLERSKSVSLILWCAACLKKYREGESARSYLDCAPLVSLGKNIQHDGEVEEREVPCPHCGGQEFQINIVG